MVLAEEMNNNVDDMLLSYDASIKGMGDLLETTHEVLQEFRAPLLDATISDSGIIFNELRKKLAKKDSLRKSDFDDMMKGILCAQDRREKAVRTLLSTFINEQKELAQQLRDGLEKFRTSISNKEAVRTNDFRNMMKDILVKQDRRKEYVTSKLKEFRNEQQETAKKLKELLAKGREIRTRDLISMLAELDLHRIKRLSCRRERKREVENLLCDFNKKRSKTAGE